jgi:hypothetical protein
MINDQSEHESESESFYIECPPSSLGSATGG